MALRSVLELAADGDQFNALAAALGEGGHGEKKVDAHVSSALRPYALAALLEEPAIRQRGPALIVATDDRSARDLAADLTAFLAPRQVRFYPSRGTGYLSHIAPPPHLAGLRVAALNALAAPPDADDPPVVVASAVALAEAIPDPDLRPDGLALHKGEEVDLTDVAELLAEAGYDRVDQVEERGQFAVRGGILDVYGATEDRAVRVELFGDEIESLRWFSTFTQRSLGESDRVELAPAAELTSEHRDLAALAGTGEEEDDERLAIAELLPVDRFQAPLGLLPDEAFVAIASVDEIPAALHDHWEDVTAAMHADDARHLYVDVADQLDERASLALSGTESGQEHSLRAQRAEFPSRTPAEGEGELEKLLRSGYRVVVAFERAGEADRARYNLDPHRGSASARRRPAARPGSSVRRGEPAGGLRFARVEARGDPLDPPGPPPPRDGRSRPGPPPHRRRDRAARRRPRGPRGPRRRPVLGLRHEDARRASPATTSSSSTRAATGSSRQPTSWRRSAATSGPTTASPRSARWAASAGSA